MAQEKKTFCVEGQYLTIRRAMKKRGWLEKVKKSSKDKNPAVISCMPRNISVDFLWTWTTRSDSINQHDYNKKPIVSRFPRAGFNTKVGLCNCLKQLYWCYKEGVADTLFPRCYSIYNTEELTAFKEDFRMTACISLLKWIVESYEKNGEEALSSAEGKIPVTAVDFAVSRCKEYISIQLHEDIDSDVSEQAWEHQWNQFLTYYNIAVHNNEKFAKTTEPSILMLYNRASYTLNKMEKYWTQMHLDGTRNIWIIKPGANSRGRGIQLMNRMEKVISKVNPTVSRKTKYIVQKYIERPLLIYDTKFDIRQWFLVTCIEPMTIWMYRESYVRFCSKCFDLLNFDESVHLSNNAVQCKYKNGKRDPKLPDENMWDCYMFQTYLRTLGKAEMWSQRIYPGMCQSIVGALLASQTNIESKNNCFELFGADFILDEAFTPWLIEINSGPSMSRSTSVTARMCVQCLEDVIKVVIDRRTNRKADTGMFELIFKQHVTPAPPNLSVSLSVRGHSMCKADIINLENLLCSQGIVSCADAIHENKSEEAVENEQRSKVTFNKNSAHALTQKWFKYTGNKCNAARNTTSIRTNRILDDQNITVTLQTEAKKNKLKNVKQEAYFKLTSPPFVNTSKIKSRLTPVQTFPKISPEVRFTYATHIHEHKSARKDSSLIKEKQELKIFRDCDKEKQEMETKTQILSYNILPIQLTRTPTTYSQYCHKINVNSNVATKFVNKKQLSSPQNVMSTKCNSGNCLQTEKLIYKSISPIYFNKNGTSPNHTNKTITSPKHINKNETSPTNINNNGTSSLFNKNGISPTHLNKNGTSQIHCNKSGTSPTHFNKNETSSTQFNKNEKTPKNFNKTGISQTHTKKTGTSPPTYSKKNGTSSTHTNENKKSPSHINKNRTSPIHKKYGEVKGIKHAEIIKEKIMLNFQEHVNVIKKKRKAIPVRKALQEVARKNEKIMVKRVKHLSKANSVGILEKNTSVGGAVTLPRQYPKRAEYTTTVQIKPQMCTISENTEENSMENLSLCNVKKEDRQLKDKSSQIKRHTSNSCKNSYDALRATEVYNQRIQKLAHTKAHWEQLLNTLQILKESENATKKTKNSSSEKLPFTWNNGPSHRQVIKNILKRYHTDQELPDFELRGVPSLNRGHMFRFHGNQ